MGLSNSLFLRRFISRKLEHKGFDAIFFIALCHLLPGRFMLGIFQSHRDLIVSDSTCLCVLIHKGLERSVLHDSNDSPYSIIETYSWTLNLACSLLERNTDSIVGNCVRMFASSPPLTSGPKFRQMAETYRKLENIVGALEVPSFESETRISGDKLRIGIFRYDYTPHGEGGTGEISYLNWLLHCLPSNVSLWFLGKSDPPQSLSMFSYLKLNEDIRTSILQARELALDLIIYTPPIWGSFQSPMSQLISYRIAKTQIYFAGDVMTSGIPTLDYFVFPGSDSLRLLQLQEGFTEKLLEVGHVNPPLPPFFKIKNTLNDKDCNNSITFVTNCHIFKINDVLLRAWTKILSLVPNSQIFLCPYTNQSHRSYAPLLIKLISKICKEYQVNVNRFVIHDVSGMVATSKVLSLGHIYLDSFPYTGSFSTAEALSLGLPSVCLVSDEANYTQLCLDVVRSVNLEDEIIMKNQKQYIERAVELGCNPELRHQLSHIIREKISTIPMEQQKLNYSKSFWKKIFEVL